MKGAEARVKKMAKEAKETNASRARRRTKSRTAEPNASSFSINTNLSKLTTTTDRSSRRKTPEVTITIDIAHQTNRAINPITSDDTHH